MSTLYQCSDYSALLEGRYDARGEIGPLLRHAGAGLGTFEGLDGELTVIGGKAYRSIPGGKTVEVPPETPIAFAQGFDTAMPAARFSIPQASDFCTLGKKLLELVENQRLIHGFTIEGTFEEISVRAAKRQEPPYGTLEEALQEAMTIRLQNVRGRLAGFFFPAHCAGLCGEGWHWHFVSEDFSLGGHVLELKMQLATGALYRIDRLEINC